MNVYEVVDFALEEAWRAANSLEVTLEMAGQDFFHMCRIGLFSPDAETRTALCQELMYSADEMLGEGLYIHRGISIFVAGTEPAHVRGSTLCAAVLDCKHLDPEAFRGVNNSLASCRVAGYDSPLLVI